ncbi:3-carboxy-cis,cis-muconate cycloisomerase [Marinibaculum pumilum]|uniref:3-carboxy-cis,cis-muconate cycloisomerase n=1 Tax=Marinibaculum pumilum TaxID=1766165 RepID=A0ABV7KVB6_9PROT
MGLTPLDSTLTGSLLSDPDSVALLDDRAAVAAMLRVEAALAVAQGRLGLIPANAADRIAAVVPGLDLDPATLAEGSADAGVPVPALVAQLRAAVGGEAAAHVHFGATSQDIVDTGLVLRLRDLLDLFDGRLAALISALAGLADRHRTTVMAGRTRTQQAVPVSFGLKAAGWLLPLVRQRTRLAELRPRLLLLQFGGAAGTLAALQDRGPAVAAALAEELDLGLPAMPWHAQRDGPAELAGWLSLTTGALGKFGQDAMLLAQSEVAEMRESGDAGRGGSSTMPQKANPVSAEALVALARFNAGMVGQMHQALVHAQERDGAAWQQEWLALPQMLVAAGAALRHAAAMAEGLQVDADRMRATLDASNGLLLAEAASFALAAHMPRPQAQDLVKRASLTALAEDRHLMDLLAGMTDAPVDWQALKDPAGYLGAADSFIDGALAASRA